MGYAGAEGYRQFLQTVQGQGTHGEAFAYRTVNTDVLGWLISRVAGQPPAPGQSPVALIPAPLRPPDAPASLHRAID